MSNYIHNIPGRLRIKTPLLKGNTTMGTKVFHLLRVIEGINTITVNPITGSMVIEYARHATTAEEILMLLKRAGYFDPSKAVTNDQYIHSKVSTMGQVAWKAFFGACVETALESSSLSLIALLI